MSLLPKPTFCFLLSTAEGAGLISDVAEGLTRGYEQN